MSLSPFEKELTLAAEAQLSRDKLHKAALAKAKTLHTSDINPSIPTAEYSKRPIASIIPSTRVGRGS